MNIPSIIILSLILAAGVAACVFIYKNRGKPSCGGDCANCQRKCDK